MSKWFSYLMGCPPTALQPPQVRDLRSKYSRHLHLELPREASRYFESGGARDAFSHLHLRVNKIKVARGPTGRMTYPVYRKGSGFQKASPVTLPASAVCAPAQAQAQGQAQNSSVSATIPRRVGRTDVRLSLKKCSQNHLELEALILAVSRAKVCYRTHKSAFCARLCSAFAIGIRLHLASTLLCQ